MVRRLVISLTALAAACGEAEPALQNTGPSYSVRDSAGVEIVESLRPRWDEGDAWALSRRPLFTIEASDGSREDLLLDPVSIDVDTRGRILIGDGNQVGWDAILVYDSTGQFLFKSGGPGEGPGEFGQLWWASAYRGDSIVAFDMSGDRLRVFDPDGRYVRQVGVPPLLIAPPARGVPSFVAGMDAVFGDGHILAYPRGSVDIAAGVGPTWFKHVLLRLTPDGESWDSLGVFEIFEHYWDGTRGQQYWYGALAVSAVGTDDLYFGRGKSFEIGRYDAGGRLTRILRRAFQPTTVTEEDKDRLRDWYLEMVASSSEGGEATVERIRQSFATAQFAETLPPYSHMLRDDRGNLWIEEFRWFGVERSPRESPGTWSVFDPAGVWLGNVETPPGFILRAVSGDRALGFTVDVVGVKRADVYRLQKPPS
jgi:hypothetical protein